MRRIALAVIGASVALSFLSGAPGSALTPPEPGHPWREVIAVPSAAPPFVMWERSSGGRICQALLDVGVDPNGADAEPDAICFQRPTWKQRVGAGEVIVAANGSVTVVDQRVLFGKFAGASDTVTFRDKRGRAVEFLREGSSFLIPLDNRLPTQVTLRSTRGLATCRITWFHGIEALPLCDTVVYHSR